MTVSGGTQTVEEHQAPHLIDLTQPKKPWHRPRYNIDPTFPQVRLHDGRIAVALEDEPTFLVIGGRELPEEYPLPQEVFDLLRPAQVLTEA